MSVILKLNKDFSLQSSKEGIRINKITGSISPAELVKLLRFADNQVNPRTARVNSITKSIHETLDRSPELFWFKSKGILLATESCEMFERGRFKLSLGNPDFEGIMDGGHNTFAIASWIIEILFDVKLKKWSDVKDYWNDNYEDILEQINENAHLFEFSIPVEIIFPNNDDGSLDEYYDYIADICSARNNNVQLRETAKGNQVGYYDYLKESLDDDFEIIWKTGEDGKIRSEDVIALATLPLIFMQNQGILPEGLKKMNKISVYSQKNKCVDYFNSIMSNNEISDDVQGKYILKDCTVKSALDLTEDIIYFFDRIFLEFPTLYHKAAPGKFGRISSVDHEKKTRVPFQTTDEFSNYKYSHGFFYPIACGVTELMELDPQTNKVRWKVNPRSLDFRQLDLLQYVELIKMVNYDPQKIGKGPAFYNEAENAFKKLS